MYQEITLKLLAKKGIVFLFIPWILALSIYVFNENSQWPDEYTQGRVPIECLDRHFLDPKPYTDVYVEGFTYPEPHVFFRWEMIREGGAAWLTGAIEEAKKIKSPSEKLTRN